MKVLINTIIEKIKTGKIKNLPELQLECGLTYGEATSLIHSIGPENGISYDNEFNIVVTKKFVSADEEFLKDENITISDIKALIVLMKKNEALSMLTKNRRFMSVVEKIDDAVYQGLLKRGYAQKKRNLIKPQSNISPTSLLKKFKELLSMGKISRKDFLSCLYYNVSNGGYLESDHLYEKFSEMSDEEFREYTVKTFTLPHIFNVIIDNDYPFQIEEYFAPEHLYHSSVEQRVLMTLMLTYRYPIIEEDNYFILPMPNSFCPGLAFEIEVNENHILFDDGGDVLRKVFGKVNAGLVLTMVSNLCKAYPSIQIYMGHVLLTCESINGSLIAERLNDLQLFIGALLGAADIMKMDPTKLFENVKEI